MSGYLGTWPKLFWSGSCRILQDPDKRRYALFSKQACGRDAKSRSARARWINKLFTIVFLRPNCYMARRRKTISHCHGQNLREDSFSFVSKTALGGALKHNSSTHGPDPIHRSLFSNTAGLGQLGISTQRYTNIVTSLTMFVSLYVARG